MKRSGYHGRDTGGANLSLISFFLFLPISLYFNLFATPSLHPSTRPSSSSFFLLDLSISHSISYPYLVSFTDHGCSSTFPLSSPNFEERERREYRKSKFDVTERNRRRERRNEREYRMERERGREWEGKGRGRVSRIVRNQGGSGIRAA